MLLLVSHFTFNQIFNHLAISIRKPLKQSFILPLTAVSLSLLLISCELTFEGGHPNTPVGNFDAFFYELENSYAYSKYKFENPYDKNKYSISEIKALLRPKIVANPTWENLITLLVDVIDKRISDPHIYSVHSPFYSVPNAGKYWQGRTLQNQWDESQPFLAYQRYSENDPWPVILTDHTTAKLAYLSTNNADPIRYAIIKVPTGSTERKIGYIYVESITHAEESGGIGRLENPGEIFSKITDRIVADLKKRGATQLILDIRSSAGGTVYNGARIAGRFVRTKKKFMTSYVTTSPGQEKAIDEYLEPLGNRDLAGEDIQLAVLINKNTCSGGEMLTLMLQQADGFIGRWGVPTHGCPGTVIDRELPNGWVFRFTSSRTYGADGTDYLKVGLQPIDKDHKPTQQYDKAEQALIAAIEKLLTY